MDVPLAHSGMELIPRKECVELLAGQRVGRLAFLVGDQPIVLPVNFAVHGDVVVFRTAEGTKLDAVRTRKVAFEVDCVDLATCTGWSVLVQGVAEDITDDEDWLAESQRAAAVPTWLPAASGHYVRVRPTLISGRRIAAGRP